MSCLTASRPCQPSRNLYGPRMPMPRAACEAAGGGGACTGFALMAGQQAPCRPFSPSERSFGLRLNLQISGGSSNKRRGVFDGHSHLAPLHTHQYSCFACCVFHPLPRRVGRGVAIPARWTRVAAPRPVPKRAQNLGCGPKVDHQSHEDGNYVVVGALCGAVRFPLTVPSLGLC